MYVDARTRFVDLVRSCSTEQLATTVPCCPAWTVRDLAAHLSSVCNAFVEVPHPLQRGDRIDFDVHDSERARVIDDVTEAAVTERRGWTLEEVLAEWEAGLARACAVLSGAEPLPPGSAETVKYAAVGDLAIHLQDARGALGLPGDRDIPAAHLVYGSWTILLERRVDDAGLGAIRIIDRVVGEGTPVAAIEGEWFEVLRALSGRRSVGQMRAMFREGDPEPYVPLLTTFSPPVHDIIEVGDA